MELTLSQNTAMDTLLARLAEGSPLLSLSGPAGTGKTTMIEALVARIENDYGLKVAVCTPTNKAAQVLRAKGIMASTFYKLFYILEDTVDGRPRFISCKRYLAEGNKGLPEGKLSYVDVLLIDEASMVTSRSVEEMRRMCGALILVGDHNQLPPVGDRDYPRGMFADLKHTATLTEVLRQTEGSLILTLADAIRTDSPRADKMLKHFEPQGDFRELVADGAQMIAYTNKERQRINLVCRKLLGFVGPYPQPGDRMIVTNNYSDDLVNGTVVDIKNFEWDGVQPYGHAEFKDTFGNIFAVQVNMQAFINDQVLSVKNGLLMTFEQVKKGEELIAVDLNFAYCLTAHKSQGSEWETVVVFDQRGLIKKIQANDPQAGMSPDEYVRRWLYTATTRARKNLYVAPTWFAQSYSQEY